jgi:hypothetical protein
MSRDMSENGAEDRRAFFKTIGRTLVLGLTGAGVTVMIQKGRIDTCINELSPCSQCVVLKQGCELPKAVEHRRKETHGTTS